MKFIDANVFLYAIIKPRAKLSNGDKAIKKQAREILNRIDSNEKVLTTVVHISEVLNILEAHTTYDYAVDSAERLLFNDNLLIESVSKNDYAISVEIAKKYKIGINDALAMLFMQRRNIKEIYSFDRHFDKIEVIKRIVD
ncbi:type II toxin-antitoxin system VapC family toxin [Candidatus Woesearchaeota archaeon]|nr:type II toxin-antitoxin system VapC family toxin [Candidatus Woesearchaeota archaeon]